MSSSAVPGLADSRRGSSPTGLFSSVLHGWDGFWFGSMDPTTLAFIRVAAGLLTFYVHLTYSWGLMSYVGPNAYLNDELAAEWRISQPWYAPPLGWGDVNASEEVSKGNYAWSIFFHVHDARAIRAFHVFFLLAMASFALGFCTKLAGIVSWIGAMSYVQRASITWFGLDTMMLILLFYLNIGPSGAVLSVDRWLERRRARRSGKAELPAPQPSVTANFAIRLIQVHFCIIYFAAGTSKLLGSSWWSATAPSQVLLNYYFAPFYLAPYPWFMQFLASHRWLWEIAMSGGVIFTIGLEVGLPFLIWDKRWRWLMICCSVLLHTLIGIFMGLVSFSLMMMAMLAAFVPPEAINQTLARLGKRFKTYAGKGALQLP
jgi:hypothetical protein